MLESLVMKDSGLKSERDKDEFNLIHAECGGEVEIIVDGKTEELPNPHFEACENPDHPLHAMQNEPAVERCKKCPDYDLCSRGETVTMDFLIVKAVCKRCGKQQEYLRMLFGGDDADV